MEWAYFQQIVTLLLGRMAVFQVLDDRIEFTIETETLTYFREEFDSTIARLKMYRYTPTQCYSPREYEVFVEPVEPRYGYRIIDEPIEISDDSSAYRLESPSDELVLAFLSGIPSASTKKPKEINKIIDTVRKKTRANQDAFQGTELEALELTIKRFVSLEQLHEDLANYRPDLIAYYKSHEISFSNGNAIDLDNYTNDKLPKKSQLVSIRPETLWFITNQTPPVLKSAEYIIHSTCTKGTVTFADSRLIVFGVVYWEVIGQR